MCCDKEEYHLTYIYIFKVGNIFMALYTFGINEKFGNNFTAANCTDNSPSKIVNMCIQYNRHNF